MDDPEYDDAEERQRGKRARTQHHRKQTRIADDAVDVGLGRINRLLNQLHEYAGPKFTSAERASMGSDDSYGGITGAIRAKSMRRIFDRLGMFGGGAEPRSLFVDIGSGSGRVVFYAAHLGIPAIGFDIDDYVVRCSYHARQHLKKSDALLLKAPAVLLKADVFRVQSLEPATHAFSFVG